MTAPLGALSALLFGTDDSIDLGLQNCSEYNQERDQKYNSCHLPEDKDPCYLLKELHHAKDYRRIFFIVVPIVFSVFAFFFNVIFLVFEIIIWREVRSGHRKRHVIVIFRSLTSILTFLLFYVLLFVWKTAGFQYFSVAIFIFIGIHDFLAFAGTYLALTGMLYLAVMHPIFYRVSLRIQHIIIVIGTIWLTSFLISILVGMYSATLFYPDTAPVLCSFDSCQLPLAICLNALLAIGIVSVLVIYVVLLCRMRMNYKEASEIQGSDRRRSSYEAMNRLGMNMFVIDENAITVKNSVFDQLTFLVATIPLLLVITTATLQLRDLSSLGEGVRSHCKTLINAALFVRVEILASVAVLTWVVTMTIDPIIHIVFDARLLSMLKYFCRSPCKHVELLCEFGQNLKCPAY